MEKFLKKYVNIMVRYRSGELGNEHLSLYDILSKFGEQDLLSKMNLSEIEKLIKESSGITKQMFSLAYDRKAKELEKINKLEKELKDLNVSKYMNNGNITDEELADKLGLSISYCDDLALPDDVEATLYPSDDERYNGIIKISKKCTAKFSYMHEIIHYFRDVGVGNKVSNIYARKKQGKTDSPEEQDVNYLTAAAIMPFDVIAKKLNKYEKMNTDDERQFISEIAEKYEQEESAVLRRIIEVRSLIDYRQKVSS